MNPPKSLSIPYLGIYKRDEDVALVMVRDTDIIVISSVRGAYQCGSGDRWSSIDDAIEYITPLTSPVTLWNQ